MKHIKQIFLMLFALITVASCSEFDDLNVDPNSATQVSPSALLSRAQYSLFNRVHGTNLNADLGMLMVQYWAQNEYTEDSRYAFETTFFNTSWEVFYTEVLKELQISKAIIENEDISDAIKANQKGIVDVMSVYAYMVLTDGFGDIPYTQALNDEHPLPAYDSQETVYNGMLSTLSAAASAFSESAPSFASGDLIYNGDVRKWRKFTNSLILRLAMRIVDVDQTTAAQYITTASSNLIASNADDALFVFDSAPDRSNPLWQNVVQSSRDDYCVSTFLVDALNSRNDPRLAKFAKESAVGGIVGMPYGLTDNEATLLKPTTSRPNDNVRAATSPSVILSHAEVKFLLAEAYQRGILSGNAADAYNDGIEASMNYWGISDSAAISAYVAAQTYDAANWKQSIGWQKWIALYMSGYEAWAEWRRLDHPQLPVPAAAETATIPTRLPYPNSEISNNSTQLNAVSTSPEIFTTKLWWDRF